MCVCGGLYLLLPVYTECRVKLRLELIKLKCLEQIKGIKVCKLIILKVGIIIEWVKSVN